MVGNWTSIVWGSCWISVLTPVLGIAEEPRMKADIAYATSGSQSMKLDLHLPQLPVKSPLILWVHGGAWRAGSKSDMPLVDLVKAGYAVASVDYRLSTEAQFPAQVHDIKAAVRYLRAQQNDLKISANQIVIAGSSAGGHLAALVGTSNGNQELEGTVGDHLKESSAVQGIVSFYGMSNLTTILAQSTPHGLKVRVPALQLLLGAQPQDNAALARLASPVFHVTKQAPPLLLLHGDQDPQAPINQAHELQGKYEAASVACQLVVLHDSAHGGKEFYSKQQLQTVQEFLQTHVTNVDSAAKSRR